MVHGWRHAAETVLRCLRSRARSKPYPSVLHARANTLRHMIVVVWPTKANHTRGFQPPNSHTRPNNNDN